MNLIINARTAETLEASTVAPPNAHVLDHMFAWLPDDERHLTAMSPAPGNNDRFTAARVKAIANDRHRADLIAGSMKLFRRAQANPIWDPPSDMSWSSADTAC